MGTYSICFCPEVKNNNFGYPSYKQLRPKCASGGAIVSVFAFSAVNMSREKNVVMSSLFAYNAIK